MSVLFDDTMLFLFYQPLLLSQVPRIYKLLNYRNYRPITQSQIQQHECCHSYQFNFSFVIGNTTFFNQFIHFLFHYFNFFFWTVGNRTACISNWVVIQLRQSLTHIIIHSNFMLVFVPDQFSIKLPVICLLF